MVIDNIWALFLSLIPSLFNIGIACYVFIALPRNKTTNVFGYFLLAIALWQVQDVLFRMITTVEQANFLDHLFCIGWISAGPLGFHFACSYSSMPIVKKWYFPVLNYAPFLVLERIYISNYNVNFEYNNNWGWVTAPGTTKIDGILRFAIFFMTMASIVVLLRHAYKMRNDKLRKLPAFLIAIGIFVPTFVGVVAQVAFPFFFNRGEVPVTSMFMTLFSVATIISLKKYRLFDISEYVEVESVLQNLKNIVLVVAPDKKVLYMNAHAQSLFNPGEAVARSQDAANIFCAGNHYFDFIAQVFDPALAGRFTKSYTTAMQTHMGTRMEVQLYAEAIVTNNQVQGVLIVGNDITAHMKMLEDLKASNERYDLVSRATNDMVWDWDLASGKIYWNKQGWKKIFHDELRSEFGTEQDWASRIHPDDLAKGSELKKRIFNGTIGDSFVLELRMLRLDGNVVYLLIRGYVRRDAAGLPVRLIGASQDVTLRRKAEIKLQEEQLAKHREIADAVIIAQENERRTIGAELHDNVNQLLTSATLYLNLARTEQENREPFFQKSESMIGHAISEVRRLSHSLIPPSWGGETLVEAISHLLEASEKSGLFAVQKDLDDFCEAAVAFKLKLNLYRIVQEQLNNIIKHAQANHVVVRLRHDEASIYLTVQDDGIGFDPSRKSKGVGLTNMETRAFLHGGSLTINAAPGGGCILQVAIPLAQPVPAVFQ